MAAADIAKRPETNPVMPRAVALRLVEIRMPRDPKRDRDAHRAIRLRKRRQRPPLDMREISWRPAS